MKIGLITPPDTVGGATLTQSIDWAVQAETDGCHSLWFVQVPVVGKDVLTTIAVLGQHTQKILLGTGVAPTHAQTSGRAI